MPHIASLTDLSVMIANLLMMLSRGMEEVKLLENASRAVGEQGVIGRAVMTFYIFALRISQLFDYYSTLQNYITTEEADKTDMLALREKRFWNFVKNFVNKHLESNCP